jgi:hypothetical protein
LREKGFRLRESLKRWRRRFNSVPGHHIPKDLHHSSR